MPSPSHGGHVHTGGARIGGGSHSSSSWGGSRGGFHGGFHHHGPWHFHFWGHHYLVPVRASGVMSFFSVILVFAIFFIFCGGIMWGSANAEIGKAERDYTKYQAMIADAETNPSLCVEGRIDDHWYDEDAGKWYIEYSFLALDGERITGHESYCVYTWEDLLKPEYKVGATIDIAVNKEPKDHEDSTIDSVPMDYKGMTLDDDGAYVAAQNTRDVGRIMLIVACCALGASVVLNVMIFCVTKKKTDANGKVTTDTNATATDSTVSAQPAADAPKYCDYCGSKLDANATKCHLCGAKVK